MTISSVLSPIERLSYDSLGSVLGLLSQVNGTAGILNDADIPVIMRDIRSLACASKAMHMTINDPRVLNIFFGYLAKTYKSPPEFFAFKLDTVGSRKWIWSYCIIQNKYDETYAIIQDIYNVAELVKEKAKSAGLIFELAEGRKNEPKPDPFTYQTQTGFLFHHEKVPGNIVTPFGKLQLYGSGRLQCPLSILELFIKLFDATFDAISSSSSRPPNLDECRIVPISDVKDLHIRKIPASLEENIAENQLQNEIGKQNLISSPWATRSVYKIRRVGDKIMPEVTLPSSRPDFELINTMWDMLEKARLGQDPIAQEKIQLYTKPNAPEVFCTLSEVYKHFFSFVHELDAQPFKEDGSKELSIGKNYSMCFALPSLHNAAKQYLDVNTHWDIKAFPGNAWVFQKTQLENEPYNLEALKIAYTQVLSEIGANWSKASFKDYPNILCAKSEETHVLFVRQLRFFDEHSVICCAAKELGIREYAQVYEDWASEPEASLPQEPRPIYLWIKKDKLELVSRLMNLREPS